MTRDTFGEGAILFDLPVMWGLMRVIAETGLWEIGGAAPTGIALYAIWVLEAGIVIVPAIMLAYSTDTPFCESCNSWTDEKPCGVTFTTLPDLQEMQEMQEALEEGDYRPLLEQGQPSPGNDALHVKIHECAHCDESTWLQIDRVMSWVNDKGEDQSSTETVIKYLSIERPEAEALLALKPEDFGTVTVEGSETEEDSDIEAADPGSDEDPQS